MLPVHKKIIQLFNRSSSVLCCAVLSCQGNCVLYKFPNINRFVFITVINHLNEVNGYVSRTDGRTKSHYEG